MIYSEWGGREDGPRISKLGFGTTRFPQEWLMDKAGFQACAALVEYAIEKGINYFDVAPTYSNGYAESILGSVFVNTKKPVYIAAKSGLMIDRTADEIRRRIDASLKMLHARRLDFYHIWSVRNMSEYQEILKPGGLYEGAKRAQEDGLISHLCISLHCRESEVLQIIEDGYFEGITISMNAMNYKKWVPILKLAKEKNMGVATMNSLGGGIIPQYHSLFESLDQSDDPVSVKALRFLSSFPEIDVMLSGMMSKEQIDENCSALEEGQTSCQRPRFSIQTAETLCSGCGYCAPCTAKIPISACMQAYNHKILVESSGKSLSEKKIINDTFIRLRGNGVGLDDFNQCITCRMCEKRCTQKLNIVERLKFLSQSAENYGYTEQAIRNRLNEIELECREFEHIAIWPACGYAERVLDFWNNPDFEARCEYYNSSPAMWGKPFRGKAIRAAANAAALPCRGGQTAVIIMNYRLQEKIYEQLNASAPETVKLIKLHRENDINWFDRAMEN